MIYIGNIEILTAKSAIYLGNVGLLQVGIDRCLAGIADATKMG